MNLGLQEDMSMQTNQKKALIIAAPYYGSLSHPTRGLSQLYFLLDIHPEEGRVTHIQVTVWNPAESLKLGGWLKQKGVQTLFCNSIEACHRLDLKSTGIRIESIIEHDIIVGIKSWLTKTGSAFLNLPKPSELPA